MYSWSITVHSNNQTQFNFCIEGLAVSIGSPLAILILSAWSDCGLENTIMSEGNSIVQAHGITFLVFRTRHSLIPNEEGINYAWHWTPNTIAWGASCEGKIFLCKNLNIPLHFWYGDNAVRLPLCLSPKAGKGVPTGPNRLFGTWLQSHVPSNLISFFQCISCDWVILDTPFTWSIIFAEIIGHASWDVQWWIVFWHAIEGCG